MITPLTAISYTNDKKCCNLCNASVATGTNRTNPGSFLKGLCGGYHVSIRANHCPAKGQPLQESFGVFFCALAGYAKTARKAAVCILRVLRGSYPSTAHMSDPQGMQERVVGPHIKRVILQTCSLCRNMSSVRPTRPGSMVFAKGAFSGSLGEYCPDIEPI